MAHVVFIVLAGEVYYGSASPGDVTKSSPINHVNPIGCVLKSEHRRGPPPNPSSLTVVNATFAAGLPTLTVTSTFGPLSLTCCSYDTGKLRARHSTGSTFSVGPTTPTAHHR